MALNSLKHGCNYEGFLPCKKQRCFFRDLCFLVASEDGSRALEAMNYGDPCPVEIAKFEILKEMAIAELAAAGVQDDTLATLIAMAEVYRDRAIALAAVEADVIREVPVEGAKCTRHAAALSSRYKQEFRAKRARLLCKFQAIKSGRERHDAER